MAANYRRAQREAERLISKYEFSQPPIDPEYIAEQEGVDVVYAAFNGDISRQLAGYSDAQGARIVVNRDMPANRKTFTIAHELGHHCLHREYVDDEGAYQVFPRFNEYTGTKPAEEQEADAFAANLLVPLGMLRKYRKFASTRELAEMFCVSEEVIKNRISWL